MNNTTWHESGHAVFANIFKDYLVIKMVTILPGHYGNGANLIGIKKSEENVIDNFHLIIVNLAGLVVEYLKDKRNDEKAFIPLIKYTTKRLNPNDNTADSFDGDFLNMQEPLAIVSSELNKTKDEILCLAMVYIANCLVKCQEFWPAIDALSAKLYVSKTLTTNEVDLVFNQIGFNRFLIDYKGSFIQEAIRLLTEDN